MEDYLYNTIPNLKAFDYSLHFDSHLVNQNWVLVNGISKKKSIYKFKNNNILEISRENHTINTSWTINIENSLSIETEDGTIVIKAYFKDDDILVLNHQNKDESALFINTSYYNDELNSIEDIHSFLKEKYKQKVSKTIYGHKFYYIEKSQEFGPYTVETLSQKVKTKKISRHCFVRDVNENSYKKRLRIDDLIKEL